MPLRLKSREILGTVDASIRDVSNPGSRLVRFPSATPSCEEDRGCCGRGGAGGVLGNHRAGGVLGVWRRRPERCRRGGSGADAGDGDVPTGIDGGSRVDSWRPCSPPTCFDFEDGMPAPGGGKPTTAGTGTLAVTEGEVTSGKSLAIEAPLTGRTTLKETFTSYTPVTIDGDLVSGAYGAKVGSSPRFSSMGDAEANGAALPLEVRVGIHFAMNVTRPWHVRFDDVEIITTK